MSLRTLARYSDKRIERFLTELANLHVGIEAGARFIKKYGQMLCDLPGAEQWGHPRVASTPEKLELTRAASLRSELRLIWQSRTREARQMRVLMLAKWTQDLGKFTFLLPPAVMHPGPFAQAILYLLNSNRALVCGNPDCPAPYFFRPRDKRRQVYCSEACAEFGQRKTKMKWWAEKGNEWRKRRQSKRGKNGQKVPKET